MSRKHPWDFKNRREQHKYLVEVEKFNKQYWRKAYRETKHTKERWRKATFMRTSAWIKKAREQGLIL